MKLDWKNELAYIRLVGPDEEAFRNAVKNVWDYIDHFEKHRRDWPSDLHEQYLVVLNERDNAWGYVEELEEEIRDLQRDLAHAYNAYQAATQNRPEEL